MQKAVNIAKFNFQHKKPGDAQGAIVLNLKYDLPMCMGGPYGRLAFMLNTLDYTGDQHS